MQSLSLEQKSMYMGLPVNIFAQSDIAECFNEKLFNKRWQHYQLCDKQLQRYINKHYSNMSLINQLSIIPYIKQKNINRDAIIKQGLNDEDGDIRRNAVAMIQYSLKKERVELIKQGLDDDDRNVRCNATAMIKYAPEKERVELIKQGLGDKYVGVRRNAAAMIQYAPEKERIELQKILLNIIKQGLGDENVGVRRNAAAMIQYAPKKERVGLIKQGLDNKYWVVRHAAATMIEYAPEKERVELIKQGLGDENGGVRRNAAAMIEYAPEKERVVLIKQGLEDENVGVRRKAAAMIEYAPEKERVELIKQGLDNEDGNVRCYAIEMIQYVLEKERVGLIKQGLDDERVDVRRKAAAMIQYVPEKEKKYLSKIITKNNQKNVFTTHTHNLYQYNDIKQKASTKSFNGATISVDKQILEGKVYHRTMDIKSGFWAQKKAFEAVDVRRADGWEYVPVEPILSFSFHDPDHIRVTNKIMHTSLQEYMKTQEYYLRQKEINSMRESFRSTLQKIGIEQFDDHEGNYALQFPYDKDGVVNTSACPRLYRIDRDTAKVS